MRYPTLDSKSTSDNRPFWGPLTIYLAFTLGLIGLSLLVGTGLSPELLPPLCGARLYPERSLTWNHLDCARIYAPIWGLKGLGFVLMIFPIQKLVGYVMCKSASELRESDLDADGNDSPALLTWGLVLAFGMAMAFLNFTSIPNYLVNVGYRGGLASLFGLLIAILVIRIGYRIRSFDEYVDGINRPNTNALAIATAGAYIVGVLIVTSS
jgi:hypothetical protein